MPMNNQDKLIRDIDTLRESIKTDWQDMAGRNLTAPQRRDIRKHIAWCINELNTLLLRLEFDGITDA